MQILETGIPDVKLIQTTRFRDARGWFAEVFHRNTFETLGIPSAFAQDNHSFSLRGVLRGLHYQLGKPQGKLVRCLTGHIWDVAVDLRRESPSFGQYTGVSLKPLSDSGELQMLWIPEGFAHGFLVLSDSAEVLYKATDFYHPAGERCIRWDDPKIGIAWPLTGITPNVSAKDAAGDSFDQAELPPTAERRP